MYLISTRLTSAALGLSLFEGLRPLAGPLLSGVLMLAGVWLVKHQLAPDHGLVLLLIAKVLVGGIVYAITVRLSVPAAVRDGLMMIGDLAHPSRSRVSR